MALDNNFDLVFLANRDIASIDGVNLVQQRVRTRLRIERGTWVYDTSKTLGSRLRALLRTSIDKGAAEAEAIVREALEEMRDIEILAIQVDKDELAPRGIAVKITFRPLLGQLEQSIPLPDSEIFSLELVF